MKVRSVLSSAVIAALGAAPAASAWAEEDEDLRALTRPPSEIEVGVGYVDESSPTFGSYTGLDERGAFLIGNFRLVSWPRPLSGSGNYWIVEGTRLGLDSRNLRLEFGTQGSYRLALEYDQLPKFRPHAQTIFHGVGTANLTLPAGWAPAATVTALAPQINANLRTYEVKTERQNYIIDFATLLTPQWSLGINFRHEIKEGTKVTGAVIGNSGGNPRSVLIPEPVDYRTNTLAANVGYATQALQLQFGYDLSLFQNEHRALAWQSPFAGVAGWAAGTGYPHGGQLGLPPDNQFHQVRGSLGLNLTPTTRLSGTVQYGRMLQDEQFLPYTNNPVLAASITQPLPRDSLDGRIDTLLIHLGVATRPLAGLDLRASYRYDDRDNKTPQAQYVYIGGDSQIQPATLATDRARTNLPLSYKQNLFRFDAGYGILPRTKLSAGYDYEVIDRTFAEVERTREHTVRTGLRREFTTEFSGAATYSRAKRKHDGYHETPFLESYSAEFIATMDPALQWDNHPLLRKFTYADRQRDKLGLALNAAPHPMVALQARADFKRDDYENSRLGLTEATNRTYTVDGAVTPSESLTLYAFYTHDRYGSEQDGRRIPGIAPNNCPRTPGNVNLFTTGPSPCDWRMTSTDKFDTVGIGFKSGMRESRLGFGTDLSYSRGTGEIDMWAGPAADPAGGLPMPTIRSRLWSLSAHVSYAVQKNASLRLSWLHQQLRMDDWAWDNITPTSLANVLTSGQETPNYKVNVVGLSFVYRYW